MAEVPETPPQLGSKTLVDRVAEVGKKITLPVVDTFTRKKACHRFMIPFDVQTPQDDRLHPGQVKINVAPHMAHVSCLGAGGDGGPGCALWNAEQKECYDVTNIKAQTRIAAALENSNDYQRLHTHES